MHHTQANKLIKTKIDISVKNKYMLLQQTKFFTTVSQMKELPLDTSFEVAFVGRSNAGKSSTINALCYQQRLAFTSKTPGRTQHINYFSVKTTEEKKAYLVDLPGYGFAAVPISIQEKWQALISQYLQKRRSLKGLVLLVDARRPLTVLDKKMLNWFVTTGKPIHILLTKADKLTYQQSIHALSLAKKTINEFHIELKNEFNNNLQNSSENISVQLFSSVKGMGIDEASSKIIKWLDI